MQVVFNSPSLHLTPVADREAGESPSDLLLTQSRAPSSCISRGQQHASPSSTLTSTITVRVATTTNTSRIPSPSPNSSSRRRRNQEMELHPTRAEQEEDTESKLMELHKQVYKLPLKKCPHTRVFYLGGTTGVDAEETETGRGSCSESTGVLFDEDEEVQ